METLGEFIWCLFTTVILSIIVSNLTSWISTWFCKPEGAFIGTSIIQVTNLAESEFACSKLLKDCQDFKALGFDCEWVSESLGKKYKPKPISLLQLASTNGLCCLFRLNQLGGIPHELKSILKDRTILKLGVNCLQDAKLIEIDYKVRVRSCLDLRHLYPTETKNSLASLAQNITGIRLNKDVKVISSNWNEEILTEDQVNYAANDAMVAVNIFKSWLRKNSVEDATEYVDVPFQLRKGFTTAVQNDAKTAKEISVESKYARKKPLYDNCWMYAPDGELLCSCDKKKADWYIQKGLAQLQGEDPYSIRLLFEPITRPSEDNDTNFYRQLKQNNCVVCGSDECYMKHYVVPKEYRKYFPTSMKSHQSHDVVLTCINCHTRAKYHMRRLRDELAEICSAPIYEEPSCDYKKYIKMKNICKTLSTPSTAGTTIPKSRRTVLEKLVKQYFELSEINDDVLKKLATSSEFAGKGKNETHGLKVVEYFKKRENGLIMFEEMWRKHFLDKLRPQYLPSFWSVHHNHKKEKILFKNKLKDNR